ncbi:MAG: tol-pal system protein YbgF [Roseovarius pacificus]|nr:tol-pal system protein YbgF [Roseovarius pacificus]
MRLFLAVVSCVAFALPAVSAAQAQEETLADIRQELSVLYVEIQKLKRELNTTGAAGQLTGSGTLIERVNAIESELQRLTSQTEQLEYKVERVAEDGANRIGDLEFRLCELEEGCDIGALGDSSTLGGIETSGGGSNAGMVNPSLDDATGDANAPQLAVSEKADFDRAKAALEAGNYAEAAAQFETFRQSYPGGPMTARAGLLRGEALEGAGDLKAAARAYLDTFSTDKTGPEAPQSLYRLGAALGQLGQTEQACVTLAEVGNRFPGDQAVGQAQSAMTDLGCP